MGDNGNAQPSTSVSFFSEYMVEKHGRKPLRSKEFVLDLGNERDRDSLKVLFSTVNFVFSVRIAIQTRKIFESQLTG